MHSVKRAIVFLISASMLTACVGNVSLWGQYQTPTPIGGLPIIDASMSNVNPTDVFVQDQLTPTPTLELTPIPTSLLSTFVTQPATATEPPLTPTVDGNSTLYYAQSGDWLPAVASRFGVEMSEITSPKTLSEKGFIDP